MKDFSFKEKQVARREQEILQTARRMFAGKGFYDTNLNDVAQEVGIARGTIYLHFPTKEDLLLAIINQAEEQLLTRLNEAIEPGDDPVTKVRKVLEELLHMYEKIRGHRPTYRVRHRNRVRRPSRRHHVHIHRR